MRGCAGLNSARIVAGLTSTIRVSVSTWADVCGDETIFSYFAAGGANDMVGSLEFTQGRHTFCPRTASIPETARAGFSKTWSDAESPDRTPAR